jgi:hypothetical protein
MPTATILEGITFDYSGDHPSFSAQTADGRIIRINHLGTGVSNGAGCPFVEVSKHRYTAPGLTAVLAAYSPGTPVYELALSALAFVNGL